MSSEAGSSDLPDPLQGYSYLSLFPRIFRGLAGAGKQPELSDLQLALKEPDRHIEQARRIVESISEDKKSDNAAVPEEPTLDIAKLEDPVDFFLAHEKLESKCGLWTLLSLKIQLMFRKQMQDENATHAPNPVQLDSTISKSTPRPLSNSSFKRLIYIFLFLA
ncbi:unnamed protein product [Rhodiola kirilowii]